MRTLLLISAFIFLINYSSFSQKSKIDSLLNVIKKEKTFPEWDDRIRYINGSVVKRVPVLTARDYVPRFCAIGATREDGPGEFVWIRKNESLTIPMIFKSYSDANAFLEYLLRIGSDKGLSDSIMPGGFPLIFRKKILNKSDIGTQGLEIIPYYR